MQHLEEGTIHAWIDDALSADERREVEAHLASCEACSQMAAEARGLVAASSRILTALDNVPGDVIPVATPANVPASPDITPIQVATRPAWHTPFWVRTAAAVLVIAGVSALATTAKLNKPEVATKSVAMDSSAPMMAAVDSPAPVPVSQDLAAVAAESAPTANQAKATTQGFGASRPGGVGGVVGTTSGVLRDRRTVKEDSIAADRLAKGREEQMTAIRADAASMRTRRDSEEIAEVAAASSDMKQKMAMTQSAPTASAVIVAAPTAPPPTATTPTTEGRGSVLGAVRRAVKPSSKSSAEAFGTSAAAMPSADDRARVQTSGEAPSAQGCYALTLSPWSGGAIPFGAPPPKIELDTIRNAAGQLLVHPGRGTASNGAPWAFWTQVGDSIYVTWRDDSRGVRLTLSPVDEDVLRGHAETLRSASSASTAQTSSAEARRISCRE